MLHQANLSSLVKNKCKADYPDATLQGQMVLLKLRWNGPLTAYMKIMALRALGRVAGICSQRFVNIGCDMATRKNAHPNRYDHRGLLESLAPDRAVCA